MIYCTAFIFGSWQNQLVSRWCFLGCPKLWLWQNLHLSRFCFHWQRPPPDRIWHPQCQNKVVSLCKWDVKERGSKYGHIPKIGLLQHCKIGFQNNFFHSLDKGSSFVKLFERRDSTQIGQYNPFSSLYFRPHPKVGNKNCTQGFRVPHSSSFTMVVQVYVYAINELDENNSEAIKHKLVKRSSQWRHVKFYLKKSMQIATSFALQFNTKFKHKGYFWCGTNSEIFII